MSRTHEHDCSGCRHAVNDGMDRRSFISAAALASISFALACGDGQIGGVAGLTGGVPGGTITVRLADYAALATVGGVARVPTTGAPVAIYRNADQSYLAFSMSCPHNGTTVNITANGFTCPNHKATFAKDGTWTGGQRTSALVAVPLTYDAVNGTLTLTGAPTTPGGGGDDDDDYRSP